MLRLTKIEDGEHWSSISDLMAGLMMIFLLIAIAYMHNIAQGQQKIKKDRCDLSRSTSRFI